MLALFALLLCCLGAAEPRHVADQSSAVVWRRAAAVEPDSSGVPNPLGGARVADPPALKRIPRGAKDGSPKGRDQHPAPHNYRHPKPYDPDGYFTTPKSAQQHTPGGISKSRVRANASDSGAVFLHNPLYPVTESSYGAYAVLLLALVLFAVGIVGNLALMCIVWHNYYLKSAWNSILASLAFWDFVVLFFCLPVVVFNELTAKRLLGDLSCRIVPYVEVTSLGVATFSLCALSIDRFHAATGPRGPPGGTPRVEPCRSILAKLSVIWVGSMVLALPELLLWQLTQEELAPTAGPQAEVPIGLQNAPAGGSQAEVPVGLQSAQTGARTGGHLLVDACVRRPSLDLPESVYALVLTYHEARMWWYFGCYFCLPLLFTLACGLVTRHVVAQDAQRRQPIKATGGGRTSSSSSSSYSSSSSSSPSPKMKKKKQQRRAKREQRLSSTVAALAAVYAACNLPENVCNVALAYVVSAPVSAATQALLTLVGQFLLFVRCAATPVLLLCACRPLGQAFMDCCCCCCDECLPASASSSSSHASTTATVASSSASPSSLSSPTSLSPASRSPSSSKEEKLKIFYDKAKESSSLVAIGTPC